MNNKNLVICAIALLVSFGLGYISRNPDNEEARKFRKELKEMEKYAEFPGEFQIRKGNGIPSKLPDLESDSIIYFEKDTFFPLQIYYWVGSNWQIITSYDTCSLFQIFPTSITNYKKDESPQLSKFCKTYSKTRVYQDMEQIKAITKKLHSPLICLNLNNYEDWTPDRKERISGTSNPDKNKDYGVLLKEQLAKHDNLLVLDFGYRKVAVSYIIKEVYDSRLKKKNIDIISYEGSSPDLYDMLNQYGTSPDVLWKKSYKLGIRH